MIGLLLLGFYLIYSLISIAVVVCTASWAKESGRSPLLWGMLAVLVMYHLLFWDLIPTYVVYNHYCKHKSGFWVYKTVEQWKAENPGVAETLTWQKLSPKYKAPNITRGYRLNERIAWVIIDHRTPLIPVNAKEEQLVDIQTGEILVNRVRIFSGYHGRDTYAYLKWYLNRRQSPIQANAFNTLYRDYKLLGKEML